MYFHDTGGWPERLCSEFNGTLFTAACDDGVRPIPSWADAIRRVWDHRLCGVPDVRPGAQLIRSLNHHGMLYFGEAHITDNLSGHSFYSIDSRLF